MPSERIQRRIDRLLDQAERASDARDWDLVLELVAGVLDADASNGDALTLRGMAEASLRQGGQRPAPSQGSEASRSEAHLPVSFASGRYAIKSFLGEGGKKKVYLAHDTTLDRDVAFALIKTEGLDDTSRQRVTREAQAMGRLGDHPNIVPIFDLGQEKDPVTGISQPFMVLPLMTGGDVEGLIEKAPDHRLPLERVLQIAKDTCEGLVFAHSKGIVHRDLKPGNVMVTERGVARIADFGLAVATDRSRLTREGMMVGTVAYMPPEQAMGGEITPRADLYSLGAMLYEMVTGRPPFLGDDDIAIIGQHINTPPVAPTWHNPQCPRTLDTLIMRLLAKDPAQRPESAADVQSALAAVAVSSPEGAGTGSKQSSVAEGSTVATESRSLDSMSAGVFVGRQKEMDQLRAGLEDALSGHGRMMTLVGEPGIGKTRTSLEVATYAGLRNCQVLWGRCYEGTGAPSYWPWVQVIRSYVQAKDPPDLKREMGSAASVIAEMVTEVKDRIADLAPPPRLDDPDAARFRLFDSITTFLKNASRTRPILLIIDDLHWSDKPSLMLLEFFVREIASSRILLVGTYRDVELNRRHPLAVTLGDLTKDRLFERVLLRGLQTDDVGRFIELAAGVKPPSALVETVFRHTEGNPLFVTETVRLLVQEGELHRNLADERQDGDRTSGGRGRGTSTWEVRIPEGVREVIGRRLDRLSERSNQMLTTAAVIGRQFRLDVLKRLVSDLSEDRLLDLLDEALASRIVEELPAEVGLYQFTHALLQETLASELSLTRKVRLHAQIAEALEAAYGDEADARAAELAYHFDQSQTLHGPDKLAHYSLIAGRQALAAYGFEEAEYQFRRGLQAREGQPEDEVTADLLYGLAQALIQTSGRTEMQRALDTLVRAFDTYVGLGKTDTAVTVAATPFPNIQGFSGRARLIERALEFAKPESREQALLLAGKAMAGRYEVYDDQMADSAARESIRIATALGDAATEMKAQFVLMTRRPGEAAVGTDRAALARVGELLRKVHDPTFEAQYLEQRSFFEYDDGLPDAARRSLELALAAAERSGNRWVQAVILSGLGIGSARDGDWETARSYLERGLLYGPRETRLLTPLCLIAAELGEAEQVELYLKRLIEMFESTGRIARFPILVFAALGRTTGQDRCPEEVFAEAMDVFGEAETPLGFRRLTGSGLVDVLLSRRDIDGLRKVVPTLARIWHPRGFSWALALALSPSTVVLGAATIADFDTMDRLVPQIPLDAGPPVHAWNAYQIGEGLLLRDRPGDRELAVKMHAEALRVAQRLGMKPLTQKILARKKIVNA